MCAPMTLYYLSTKAKTAIACYLGIVAICLEAQTATCIAQWIQISLQQDFPIVIDIGFQIEPSQPSQGLKIVGDGSRELILV